MPVTRCASMDEGEDEQEDEGWGRMGRSDRVRLRADDDAAVSEDCGAVSTLTPVALCDGCVTSSR